MIDRSALKHFVETEYIGFKPAYDNIKTVHLAHGMFLGISEKEWDTSRFFEFIRPFNAKGITEKGHDNSSIYKYLVNNVNAIDERDVSLENLLTFRTLTNKIACMDKGAFARSMQSYSIVNEHYLGGDTIGVEIGEFIAFAIRKLSPNLYKKVKNWLQKDDDIVSILFAPVESNVQKDYKPTINLKSMKNNFLNYEDNCGTANLLADGMKSVFNTMSEHMEETNNYLSDIRELVLLSSFLIIRYMSCLEDIYVKRSNDNMMPLLLDFTNDSNGAVAIASKLNYTMICNSISRFYARKFGEKIFENNDLEEILITPIPATKQKELSQSLWEYCLNELKEKKDLLRQEEKSDLVGFAIYGIMQMETTANPNGCMRKIGTEAGIFYPSTGNPPIKRMRLKQDTFEAVIKSNIKPNESLTINELQEKLWKTLGIVIGGRKIDEERLYAAGIKDIDTDSLKENQKLFINKLESLDFAKMLADGVLQVRLGDR